MLDTIRTIDELHQALETNFNLVQHYQSQVTVEEDLCNYLKWLSDNEVTTEIHSKLKRAKTRAKGIHPSSACKKGVCLLKLYYECTHEVEPSTDSYNQKSQLTWDIGTLLHEMYQQWFRDMYGDQFTAEVPLRSSDGYIKSHTDGVFNFTYYRFVLEIKSIKEGGNYGWEKVQAKPFEDNVRQAHFYMKLADAPFALLLYVNKNAGEFKEHAVAFNQAIWDELEETIQPVIDAAYLNGPPVRATKTWACRWCHFKHNCPEHGGDDVAAF